MTSRSRWFIVLGVIGFAVAVALRDTLAKLPLLAIGVALAVYNVVLAWRQMQEANRRPAAFTVSGHGFGARLQNPMGYFAMMMMLLFAGVYSGDSLDEIEQHGWFSGVFVWVDLALSGILIAMAVLIALLAWGMDAAGIELTPDGVATRMLWDRRFIPWEALAPGGPWPPGPVAGQLRLVFARPELVRYARFRLPSHAKDMIATGTSVHPSFLADAIRWYVEHPQDRAAIGTEAEHARLVAAVGAAANTTTPVPPPPQPQQVRRAIRLVQVGVVFGPLAAIAEVALLSRFDPLGWTVNGVATESWFLANLAASTLIVFVALAAILAVESLKRGNESGRVGLIVVSALAMAWALVPFDLALLASGGLTSLLTIVMVVKHLGYLGLGVATLVLLLGPDAQAFTRRRTEMRQA